MLDRQPVFRTSARSSPHVPPQRRLYVLCARRARAVCLDDECADCPRCVGWVVNPDGSTGFVLCDPAPDAPSKAQRRARVKAGSVEPEEDALADADRLLRQLGR